jgi:hypothetical protein
MQSDICYERVPRETDRGEQKKDWQKHRREERDAHRALFHCVKFYVVTVHVFVSCLPSAMVPINYLYCCCGSPA